MEESLKGLYDLGCPIVTLTLRGCGGLALTSPALYHAGQTEDLAIVLAEVQALLPGRNWHAQGLSQSSANPDRLNVLSGNSLGAGYVLNMTGEMGETCPLTSCATISNVMCYGTSAECLEQGTLFQRLINWSLGVTHCKSVKENEVIYSVSRAIAQV